jgi:predicted ATPase/Tfp pilus assembly protein PilF
VLVPLASVRDPTLVVQAVASALGLGEEAGRPLLEIIVFYLRKRKMLLVLDNFEQVAAAAPDVVGLLTTCPLLRVLVTSRMPLHVRGEHELDVPPLATPDQQTTCLSAVEPLSRFPSVELFTQRAQAVKPDFELTDANLADVAWLCHQLDGLPLAIELAAAQIKFLPPRLLLEHFERRLDLLTAGPQDLPARQRTMRDAIAWSYDLLGAEQRLFCRLAAFAGGCDVAAVTVVCAGLGDLALDPLRGMMALVDKSLVMLDEHPSRVTVRFRMLETVREFALEQLEARGESEGLRQRHADYFLALVEQAEPALWKTSDMTIWTQQLDAELDNVRAALGWYLGRGQATQALRLAGMLGMYWHFTGLLGEGRRWLEAALTAAPDATPEERARALCHLGALALHQADHPRALSALEESLSLWQTLGDARWMALALFRLAHIWRDAGDLERARPLFEASLALSNEHGNEWGIVRGGPLMLHGTLLLEQGDYAAAVTNLQEVLELGRRLGSQVFVGGALNGLAWVAHATGDAEQAVALAEDSLAHYRAAGDNQGTSDSLSTAGWLALWSGNFEQATRHFSDLFQLASERGRKRHTASALRGLGVVAFERGDLERAARLVAQATTLWPVIDLPHPPSKAAVECRIARAREQLGETAWQAAWTDGESLTFDLVAADVLVDSYGAS